MQTLRFRENATMRFRIGETYRYKREVDVLAAEVDNHPNFHHVTHVPGLPRLQMESGIDFPAGTNATDGKRVAAVLLSSNFHKVGSLENPWHDEIEPDQGYARYYGDNRTPGNDPSKSAGNRALLAQFELHTSGDARQRKLAAPILIFRSGRKGYKEFCGLGVLTGAHRVTQYSQRNGGYFTNYLFDIAILTLTEEDECVRATWIRDRRDASLTADLANFAGPSAWRTWVTHGTPALDKLRRRVARYRILSKEQQVPAKDSPQRKSLEEVYGFYDGRKARFEALASMVCESSIRQSGGSYHRGWLTKSGGDGGLDFVGRLDVGETHSRTRMVVLGQAKCEKIDSPTGGNHVARTVARLRRGWLGAYVTTSYFSPAVQKEVYEDRCPILLFNGRHLIDCVSRLQLEGGYPTTRDFLEFVDSGYAGQVSGRDPEEVLWD